MQTVHVGEMNTGERLKYHRDRRKLTQEQLAKKLGWVQSQVCRAETGETPMSIKDLEAVSKVLGLTVADFLPTKKRRRAA